MTKRVVALPGNQLSALQVVQIRFKSDSSQRHNHPQVLQSLQFTFEVRSAVGKFLGQRLVVGRGAARGGGDVEVREHQAVVTVGGRGLTGKARFM